MVIDPCNLKTPIRQLRTRSSRGGFPDAKRASAVSLILDDGVVFGSIAAERSKRVASYPSTLFFTQGFRLCTTLPCTSGREVVE